MGIEAISGMWCNEDTGESFGDTTKIVLDKKPKIILLKNKNIEDLSENELKEIIYYDNHGKWITKYFGGYNLTEKKMTPIFKKNNIPQKDEFRIRRLFELISTNGCVLKELDKNKICHSFKELIEISDLDITNRASYYNFLASLKKIDFIREITITRKNRKDSYVVVNPRYVMNNPTVSDLTAFCYYDIIEDTLTIHEKEYFQRQFKNVYQIR